MHAPSVVHALEVLLTGFLCSSFCPNSFVTCESFSLNSNFPQFLHRPPPKKLHLAPHVWLNYKPLVAALVSTVKSAAFMLKRRLLLYSIFWQKTDDYVCRYFESVSSCVSPPSAEPQRGCRGRTSPLMEVRSSFCRALASLLHISTVALGAFAA